jgi:hypothetical protein
LLSLAMRKTIEGGDVFALRVRRSRSAGLVVPLQIQLKEADHLDAAKFEDRPGGRGSGMESNMTAPGGAAPTATTAAIYSSPKCTRCVRSQILGLLQLFATSGSSFRRLPPMRMRRRMICGKTKASKSIKAAMC